MENIEPTAEMVSELAVTYGPKLVMVIITLVIGFPIVGLLTRVFRRSLERGKVEASLRGFLSHLVHIVLKVLLSITVISMLGVEMTSFIAILGAAGLAVGLALSGTLQNFAGGVMILIFHPYRVGDVIEALGYLGKVKEIQIFNTIVTTPDNKTIILPNGDVSGSSLVNFSTEATRRVDFSFGIGYGDDIDKARKVIRDIVVADARVHDDPEPLIVVGELADSSVNLIVRVWVNGEDYWDVFFETMEAVKKAFDANGISIPFPQQDVHLIQA